MPRATMTGQDTVRKELKTLPGGYVVLKRMTYGEFLARREMSGVMSLNAKQKNDVMGTIVIAQTKVTVYEFGKCIVEHNLEDDNGNLMNFLDPKFMNILDPKIGDEIGTYIDEMHQFTEDTTLPNA